VYESRSGRGARVFGYVSLFGSFGTLVCCALPSLLALLGLGATVAAFLTAVPWLVTLSQHKALVFAASGALIATNFAYVYRITPNVRATSETCASDSAVCAAADRVSRTVLWASLGLYGAGFFTAFVLGPLLDRWG
jgi:hypothetical protein